MGLFFACILAMGLVFFLLFSYDMIQGKLTRYTTWKELTDQQWVFFIGTFGIPVGLFGLLVVRYTS